MEKNYAWKRNIFTNTYYIFDGKKQIGFIKHAFFSKTKIEINSKKYYLKSYGIFNRKTNIIDVRQNRIVGKMKYNNRFTKARVSMDNTTVYWKYRSIFRHKWKIHDARGLKIKYKSFFIKGNIHSNAEDDISVLLGLYLAHNYFLIVMALFIALILKLWVF